MASGATQRFKVKLEASERGAVRLIVPFDPGEVWGRKAPLPIQGTLNGHAFSATLTRRGGAFFTPLNKELRSNAGVDAGDTVEVIVAPAEAGSNTSALPADLEAALKGEKAARAFLDGLSSFYRNTYVKWIESAKKPETRASRVAETVKLLKASKKQR